jgi:hypothetical protein
MSQEPDWGYDPWLMEGGPLGFLERTNRPPMKFSLRPG